MSKQPKIDHELKTWPEFFRPVMKGTKTFEIRDNGDREFKVGDVLELREWNPQRQDPRCAVHNYLEPDGRCTCGTYGKYTGRRLLVRVTYITDFAQDNDQVVMSIVKV